MICDLYWFIIYLYSYSHALSLIAVATFHFEIELFDLFSYLLIYHIAWFFCLFCAPGQTIDFFSPQNQSIHGGHRHGHLFWRDEARYVLHFLHSGLRLEEKNQVGPGRRWCPFCQLTLISWSQKCVWKFLAKPWSLGCLIWMGRDYIMSWKYHPASCGFITNHNIYHIYIYIFTHIYICVCKVTLTHLELGPRDMHWIDEPIGNVTSFFSPSASGSSLIPVSKLQDYHGLPIRITIGNGSLYLYVYQSWPPNRRKLWDLERYIHRSPASSLRRLLHQQLWFDQQTLGLFKQWRGNESENWAF